MLKFSGAPFLIMANLIIPFPEGTRTVVLRGTRITIGRLPENTIQICDRTISAHHAELVLEGDHYRIQDLDATNGVLVDGRQVRDFHLREGCTLRLGGVECQFQLADPAAEPPGEVDPLPGRGEVNAVRDENARLKAAAAALQKQVETMTASRAELVAGTESLVLEKADKLAGEIANLWRLNHEQHEKIQRLSDSLSVMRRDCQNLQKAYDEARAALPPKVVPVAPPRETPVATPVTATAPLSMPPQLPKPPGSLGISNGNGAAKTSTPTRRPASAVQLPPVRVLPAQPVAALQPVPTGPRGTQRLVE